ncbi:MAG: hypothetical protein ABFD62_10285 [Syntrophaceae bacterium]
MRKSVPVLSAAFLVFFSACLPLCAWGEVKSSESPADLKLKIIAVAPFRSSPESGNGRDSARCPVTGAIFRTCPIPAGSERILEDLFVKKTAVYSDVSWKISEKSRSALSPESFKMWKVSSLQKVGRDLNADAVITGHVFCFRERVGYPLSVEKPASVAFGVYLVRTSDGAILWKGIFTRTQQSLFENLLQAGSFIKGGGKWLTSEELADLGLDEILATFPVRVPENAAERIVE